MRDVTVSGHISEIKWTALVLGGVVAGLLMALELFLGVEFVVIWLWQSPPGWIGAFFSLILSVIGPVVGYLVCRSGRRRAGEVDDVGGGRADRRKPCLRLSVDLLRDGHGHLVVLTVGLPVPSR